MAVITALSVAFETGPAPLVYQFDWYEGAQTVNVPPSSDPTVISGYTSLDLTSPLENPLFNVTVTGGGSTRPASGFLYPRGTGDGN